MTDSPSRNRLLRQVAASCSLVAAALLGGTAAQAVTLPPARPPSLSYFGGTIQQTCNHQPCKNAIVRVVLYVDNLTCKQETAACADQVRSFKAPRIVATIVGQTYVLPYIKDRSAHAFQLNYYKRFPIPRSLASKPDRYFAKGHISFVSKGVTYNWRARWELVGPYGV